MCKFRKQEQTTMRCPPKRERIDFSLILLKWSLVTETERVLCVVPPSDWLAYDGCLNKADYLATYPLRYRRCQRKRLREERKVCARV